MTLLLALTYAEVDYETLWDEDVHYGKLQNYENSSSMKISRDSMENFIEAIETHNGIKIKKQFELVASTLGYKSVHDQKKATAKN